MTAGCGVAGYVLLRWSRRRAPQLPLAAERAEDPADAGGAREEEEEEDHCAICLEVPQRRCRTACGHRFCVGCFRAWADRQVPYSVTARCPLCVTPVVCLHAEFAGLGPAERCWVWQYNLLARPEMLWARKVVDGLRFALGACACMLYVFSGHVTTRSPHRAARSPHAPTPCAPARPIFALPPWRLPLRSPSLPWTLLSPACL